MQRKFGCLTELNIPTLNNKKRKVTYIEVKIMFL